MPAMLEEFYREIGSMTESERFSRLFLHLQNQDQNPLQVTDGYRAIARLVRSMR